jgi:D-alanyl-D-alanine dipeptidase
MYNKLIKSFLILRALLLIFSTTFVQNLSAQDSSQTRPAVTSKWKEFKKQVKVDPAKKMIELKSVIPGITYDLRYASTNNFMKRLMYPATTRLTFLRLSAAEALKKVQEELQLMGLGLKIFDAYRPYSVTLMFWDLVKDERYVANPAKGSGHNRGIAVDLTIINSKTGEELNMGTDFDNFSDTAHHNFINLSEEILQNRILLRSTMEKHGFKMFESEWWHYFLPESNKYELLDIEFKKLSKFR